MNPLNHVAIIMDGNGRWGLKNHNSRNKGHKAGLHTVEKIIEETIKQKIKYLTLFAFSSENWKRPKNETSYLFKLIKSYFLTEISSIIKQGIKLNIFGELNKFSSDLKLILKKSTKLTKKNKKIIVNLAINYGSKKEIFQAFKKSKKNLTIKNFEKNLFTKNMKYPDILIRTGGYQRLSNFLLWQMAYTELFFLKKLWPDFNANDLSKIIKKYKNIKRNYGNI